MIYLLKFGASWILPPGIFVVAMLALAWHAYRRAAPRYAAALAAVALVLWLTSTSLVAGSLMRSLESEHRPPSSDAIADGALSGCDVIVVLGGGATLDTPDVGGTGGLTSTPSGRVLTAARLYRRLRLPVILTGGQVYADSGAEDAIGKRVLMSLGVPEGDIITEGQSLTTSQNARYTAKLMQKRGYERPLLVTSAFHMRRAVMCFAKQRIGVVAYPTDYMANLEPHSFHYNQLMPQAGALATTALVCQERLRTLATMIFE